MYSLYSCRFVSYVEGAKTIFFPKANWAQLGQLGHWRAGALNLGHSTDSVAASQTEKIFPIDEAPKMSIGRKPTRSDTDTSSNSIIHHNTSQFEVLRPCFSTMKFVKNWDHQLCRRWLQWTLSKHRSHGASLP